MGITAKEIAVLAGVSRGTVDRALKNRPGISEETKKKVLAIAEKYDYKPNIIGKALVYSGRPIRIPVLLNSVGNPFFDDVKAGLLAAGEDYAGYGFSLAFSEFKGYDPEALLRLLDALPEDTAQLILTPICHSAVEEKLRQLEEKGVRIVMLSSSLNSLKDAVYVGCDYRKSGRVAGRLGTTAFESGLNKENGTLVPAAETLSCLAALCCGGAYPYGDIEEATDRLCVYNEHTWGYHDYRDCDEYHQQFEWKRGNSLGAFALAEKNAS